MADNKTYISSTQVASSTPFDNTSIPYVATDVQTALLELRNETVLNFQSTATTLNGTLTLVAPPTNYTAQFLTGTATGYSIVMPDATTLFKGSYYRIYNTGTQVVTIKDGSTATLFSLAQSSIGFLTLEDNSTTAGVWIHWQSGIGTATGIISYNIISSTTFASSANADTLITGMTVMPQAGTYAVWYNAQNIATGSGQQSDVTVYNGASAVTDSKRSNLSTSGSHIFQNSTQTIAQFNGTNACAMYVNPNGNSLSVGARSMLLIRLGT